MKYLGYTIEGGSMTREHGHIPHTITAADGKVLGKAYSIPGAKRMVHVALGLDKCPQCGGIGQAHYEFVPVVPAGSKQCRLSRSQMMGELKRARDSYANSLLRTQRSR